MTSPSSNFFELQAQSQEEVEEWTLILINALRSKSKDWELKITEKGDGEVSFVCTPSLTNEEVSSAFIRVNP